MIKKVIVVLNNIRYNVEIDNEDFEDHRVEACTRIVEKLFGEKNYEVTPVMFCEEVCIGPRSKKKKAKFATYNTYKVLINAGFHAHAERLREFYKKGSKIDLATEPLQSKFE
jgi:hypothetical protein